MTSGGEAAHGNQIKTAYLTIPFQACRRETVAAVKLERTYLEHFEILYSIIIIFLCLTTPI